MQLFHLFFPQNQNSLLLPLQHKKVKAKLVEYYAVVFNNHGISEKIARNQYRTTTNFL